MGHLAYNPPAAAPHSGMGQKDQTEAEDWRASPKGIEVARDGQGRNARAQTI